MSRQPLDEALTRVGDRWSMLVIDALREAGALRFGELLDAVAPISPNILSARLKHLADAGVVESEPYSTRPRRLSYSLTPAGADLGRVLTELASWGARMGSGGPGEVDEELHYL